MQYDPYEMISIRPAYRDRSEWTGTDAEWEAYKQECEKNAISFFERLGFVRSYPTRNTSNDLKVQPMMGPTPLISSLRMRFKEDPTNEGN